MTEQGISRRKNVAIWIAGIGLFLWMSGIANRFLANYLQALMTTVFILLVVGGLYLLKPLANTVCRVFIKRWTIALYLHIGWQFLFVLVNIIYNPVFSAVMILFYIAITCYMISAVALFFQNYNLSDYTKSKLNMLRGAFVVQVLWFCGIVILGYANSDIGWKVVGYMNSLGSIVSICIAIAMIVGLKALIKSNIFNSPIDDFEPATPFFSLSVIGALCSVAVFCILGLVAINFI